MTTTNKMTKKPVPKKITKKTGVTIEFKAKPGDKVYTLTSDTAQRSIECPACLGKGELKGANGKGYSCPNCRGRGHVDEYYKKYSYEQEASSWSGRRADSEEVIEHVRYDGVMDGKPDVVYVTEDGNEYTAEEIYFTTDEAKAAVFKLNAAEDRKNCKKVCKK